MSSYFPNSWPLSYLNLTNNTKTYIRRQQHKNIKHQDIKQKEPPQKYRLGTISNTKLQAGLNRFYMAITSPSASAVVHKSDCAYHTFWIKRCCKSKVVLKYRLQHTGCIAYMLRTYKVHCAEKRCIVIERRIMISV